jgi:pyrroline-5-carboxylate reductase
MEIAMIGGGTMGEALAKSLLSKKVAAKEDITFSDVVATRLDSLKKRYGTRITGNNVLAVKDADVIILAIKPQDLLPVLESLAGHVKSKLVISIAAGITLGSICNKLNYSHVVRAMPNTPAQVGKGMTAWTAAKEVTKQEMTAARTILSSMGEEQYFGDEKYIDMATAVSGSGPAYVFLFIESFIDAGVHIGLPRPIAEKLAIETIVGSAEAMKKMGRHPAEMKNMVTSPGGTTAEALLRLEEGGLRSLVINAVIAAYNKAKSLGAK